MTIEVKQEYQWNGGFGASLDIKKVVQELNDIQKEVGEISPESIVEAARKKDSELHSYFEWNNTKAADKYRLQQASELIRRIEVKVIKDGEPQTLRAYEIANRVIGEKNYVSFESGEGFERAKEIVLSDLLRASNRLQPYKEYFPALAHIKRAIKELSKVSTEIKTETKPLHAQAAVV